MPKEVFVEVFRKIEDLVVSGTRRSRLDPMIRFAITIWFYATGGYQSNILQDRVSQTGASRAIREVTDALKSRLPEKLIQFPNTTEALDAIKLQLYKAFTHVSIQAPDKEGNVFVDRSYKHSLNVQDYV